VISLVDGYLTILSGMLGANSSTFDQAFNLGPIDTKKFTVSEVLNLLSEEIPYVQIVSQKSDLPESRKLGLNSNLAIETIGWSPRWDTRQVIEKTVSWYKSVLEQKASAHASCKDQIMRWIEVVRP
jgi:CDP-glucose 4,6-dehydratase